MGKMLITRAAIIENNIRRRPVATVKKLLQVEQLLWSITHGDTHERCEEIHSSPDCQCATLYASDARDILATV